jgi:hypothetical protein
VRTANSRRRAAPRAISSPPNVGAGDQEDEADGRQQDQHRGPDIGHHTRRERPPFDRGAGVVLVVMREAIADRLQLLTSIRNLPLAGNAADGAEVMDVAAVVAGIDAKR